MYFYLPKLSKHLVIIFCVLLLPAIALAQFITAEDEVTEYNLTANGGTYAYRATVKTRANNPAKNEVRVQLAIVKYEITEFYYNGERYEDLYPDLFPLTIENIRSDITLKVIFTTAADNKVIERVMRGVGKGEFDITHLTQEEVDRLKEGFYGIKTKEDFLNTKLSLSKVSLQNSYFEALDELKTRRKNEVVDAKRTKQLNDQSSYLAEQKKKAQQKLKELEIAAERDRKNQELADLNAKVASGYKATNAGYQQTGYQQAQRYINQMNADFDALQNTINTSVHKFFADNKKQESAMDLVNRAERGYDEVNRERKRRKQQIAPIMSLYENLQAVKPEYGTDNNYFDYFDSGTMYIKLVYLSNKTSSNVHTYTNLKDKAEYVPSIKDFKSQELPVYNVYHTDIIEVPISDIKEHEYLFNQYHDNVLQKSNVKFMWGTFVTVIAYQDKNNVSKMFNLLEKNYDPTQVLDFRKDNSKFSVESFERYVSKNLEEERKYNERMAQHKLLQGGNTTKTYPNGDIYTGDFKDYKRHGWGKLVSEKSGYTYEGQWENDMQHGYGKKVYKSGTIYEGEFYKNTKQGYGKETHEFGVYEGEFKNGYINGMGEFHYNDANNGDTRYYKGMMKFTCAHGLGTMHYTNGDIYVGNFDDCRRSGNGKMTYANGIVYEGEWKDHKQHGKGLVTYTDGSIYKGEFSNGNRHGKGKEIWADKRTYEGNFENGSRSGLGVFTWPDGGVYSGNFIGGLRSGKGEMTYASGSVYVGEWRLDKRNGKGIITYAGGSVYEGEFEDNIRTGKGKMTFANGDVYDGQWQDDNFVGEGTYRWANGTEYYGDWFIGKRHGEGVLVNSLGHVYEGSWEKDKMHGEFYYTENNEAGTGKWANGEVVYKEVFYIGAKLKDNTDFGSWVLDTAIQKMPKPSTGSIDVLVMFTINEKGEVQVDDYQNTYNNVPKKESKFNYGKELKKIIKSSPDWTPATLHGEIVAQKQLVHVSITSDSFSVDHNPIIE